MGKVDKQLPRYLLTTQNNPSLPTFIKTLGIEYDVAKNKIIIDIN